MVALDQLNESGLVACAQARKQAIAVFRERRPPPGAEAGSWCNAAPFAAGPRPIC
jgi:hypothetical protein